jgi:transcription-repair coupling factor (superfamily II helicase)
MERGGQVFFVHNRIESIGRVRRMLEEFLPAVRITVAHGQMPEAELEKAMRRFFSREADLLLATAIVENGLDIPSANTILMMPTRWPRSLSARGRVGR